MGATVPSDFKDGLPQRRDFSALERLKVQLLGKRAAGKTTAKGSIQLPNLAVQKNAAKPPPSAKRLAEDESDDEEDGRASAVVASRSRPSKKGRKKLASEAGVEEELQLGSNAGEAGDLGESGLGRAKSKDDRAPKTQTDSKRKASSFMDEILAEKARKQKKRKQKKQETGQDE